MMFSHIRTWMELLHDLAFNALYNFFSYSKVFITQIRVVPRNWYWFIVYLLTSFLLWFHSLS